MAGDSMMFIPRRCKASFKRKKSLQPYNRQEAFGTPSAGIEPTSQEPESYVLSVAPRGQIIQVFYKTLVYNTKAGRFLSMVKQ
ncbi:hypothetical protein B14911_05009 [Bacillus sp. NRRL B-14911]|nr:hypothetical protein B14911_05009 [Bacillus sp. NRRL B-14911]